MRRRGLNLVEVLVAVCLIAVLAVVSLPMLTRANGEARSAACRANLMTLGQHLDRYQQSHGELPALMNRDDLSLDVPTIDSFLDLPADQRSVLRCPSDTSGCFERSGTSYGWFATWDNQRFNRASADADAWLVTPVLADKAPYHTDQTHAYNALLPASDAGPAVEGAPPFIVTPYAMPY